MNILGISALYHDSGACLVKDGEIVAAAQEERFTRKKHDSGIPTHAAAYCLHEGKVGKRGLDLVMFYDKPITKFTRLLTSYSAVAPGGLSPFLKAAPVWLKDKAWVAYQIEAALKGSLGYKPGGHPVRRAPRLARGQRLLPLSLRRRGHHHRRRRGRVDDHLGSASARATASSCCTSTASRTRWACSTRPSRTSPASRSTPASTS